MNTFAINKKEQESKKSPAKINLEKPGVSINTTLNAGNFFLQRKTSCACGGDCPTCQANHSSLPISQPTDASEIEADQIADKVMRKQMIAPAELPSSENSVSRKNNGGSNSFAPKIVHDVLSSGGKPLEANTRSFMESHFNRDFGSVKIHDNDQAAKSASSINALAYTSGDDIVFNSGQYDPHSESGKRLLAHELTHVVQQSRGGRKAISRSVYKVGGTTINVDWSGITTFAAGEFLNAVLEKYESYTDGQRSVIEPKVNTFTDDQLKKLLFAIDLLSDNALTGFDKKLGVNRLIAYVPSFMFEPMAADYQLRNFENEVLRVSGWLEKAFTSGLARPDAQTQSFLTFLYTEETGGSPSLSSSSCPATRTSALNEVTLRNDLPPLVRTYLQGQVKQAQTGGVASQNIADITPIATIIQNEALAFFSPYIGHARNRDFLQTWRYAAHLTPSTAPNAIPDAAKRAYVANRAKGEAKDSGLFSRTNYDSRCAADLVVFNSIVDGLLAEATVQTQLAAIMSWKSFTEHGPGSAETVINLQYHPAAGECVSRWRVINTLCHEILHAYVSQRFYDAAGGRRLITEGFTEVLGDELYEEIRKRATNNSAYRPQFEVGITGGCTGVAIPPPVLEYGDDGLYADRIKGLVGPDNFRAGYFLGRLDLVGLQPKLISGQENTASEIEADSMAEKVMQMPTNGSRAKHLQKKTNGGGPTFAVPRIVNDVINSSSGKPLDNKTRSFMEARFEHDFGNVKIHDDGKAAMSAGSINARAYTVGENIVFNSGGYDPNSDRGKHLLAHELAHVVQQNKTAQRKIMRAVDEALVEKEFNAWVVTEKKEPEAIKKAQNKADADFPLVAWEFIKPKILNEAGEPLPKPENTQAANAWADNFTRAEIVAGWLFTLKQNAASEEVKALANGRAFYILDALAAAGFVSKAMALSGNLDIAKQKIIYETIYNNPSAASAGELETIINSQCEGVSNPADVPVVRTFTDGSASPLKTLPADKTKAIFKVLVTRYGDQEKIKNALAEVFVFNPGVRTAISDALMASEFGNPDLLFKVLQHPWFTEPGYKFVNFPKDVIPKGMSNEDFDKQRMVADMPWVYTYKQLYYVQFLIDLAASQNITIPKPGDMTFPTLKSWLDTQTENIGAAAKAKFPTDPQAIFEIYENIADIFFFHVDEGNAVPDLEGKIGQLKKGEPSEMRFAADCDVLATYAMRLLNSAGIEPVGYMAFEPLDEFKGLGMHMSALIRKDNKYYFINNKDIVDAAVSETAPNEKKQEALRSTRDKAVPAVYGTPPPTKLKIYYQDAGANGKMSPLIEARDSSLERPDLL